MPDPTVFLSLLRCFGCCAPCKDEIDLCLHYDRQRTSLADKKNGLQAVKTALLNEIHFAPEEVNKWMKDVDHLCNEIDILVKQHKNCSLCCHRYKIGADIAKKLINIKDLEEQLSRFRENNMIVKKSDMDQLRTGWRNLLAMKRDLEEKFQGGQFTKGAENWMEEVGRRDKEIEIIVDATTAVIGQEVVAMIARIGDLMTQREKWNDKDIVVEMSPKQHDVAQLESRIDFIFASKKDLEEQYSSRKLKDMVQKWMAEVDKQCREGKDILTKAKANSGHDYPLGVQVVEMRNVIDKLVEQRSKWVETNIVADEHLGPVVEIPDWRPVKLIDMEPKVTELLGYLRGDQYSIIGILGVGGIGKTTLLKELNNTLYRNRSDDITKVIFVSVSKNFDICTIQKVIALRLGVTGKEFTESNMEHNSQILCAALSKQRYIMLLDDIWQDLDLSKIGIRDIKKSDNCSKIVITTRFERICRCIGVDKTLHMEYLSDSTSWKLFSEAAGGEMRFTDSKILRMALDVAMLCGGLPCLLNAAGQAVVGIETVDQWENFTNSKLLEIAQDVGKQFGSLPLTLNGGGRAGVGLRPLDELEDTKNLLCRNPEDQQQTLGSSTAAHGDKIEYSVGSSSAAGARDMNNITQNAKETVSSFLAVVDAVEGGTSSSDVPPEFVRAVESFSLFLGALVRTIVSSAHTQTQRDP